MCATAWMHLKDNRLSEKRAKYKQEHTLYDSIYIKFKNGQN